jgi:L-alanine-DL-glutamate epimerase-like enolase superfamily enzyme
LLQINRAWLPKQVPEVIAQRAADVIVTDPHQLGGLAPFQNALTVCETAGIQVIKNAFADLGITAIASSHVLAAMPSPQLGHQQFLTFLVHDLVAEKVEFVDGNIAVPTGPGLGIELDRDALKFYEGVYQKYGEFEGYGPITPESPLPPDLHVAER